MIYQPSLLQIAEGYKAVLDDKIEGECEAIFIHGSSFSNLTLDTKLLLKVLTFYKNGLARKIVMNPISVKECKENNLAESVFLPWSRFFVENGVQQDDIISIPVAMHTALESRGFLEIAKEQCWQKIVISAHPHHLLRCFLQIVAIMKEMNFFPKVYCLSHSIIEWDIPLRKPVMGGGEIVGTYSLQISAEMDRIFKYSQPLSPSSKSNYTPHSTLEEMFAYLLKRG